KGAKPSYIGKGGWVYVLSNEGNLKWSFKLKRNVGGIPAFVVSAGDLNGDLRGEVVAASYNLHIFDFKGSFLREYEIKAVVDDLVVSDLDGDGTSEIIFGLQKSGSLFCLRKEGRALSWKFETGGPIKALYASDLDRDGFKEVIFSLDRYIYVLDYEGDELWYYFLREGIDALTVADYNNDGEREILFAAQSKIYSIDKDGKKQKLVLETKKRVLSLKVADTNMDGANEIIYLTRSFKDEKSREITTYAGNLLIVNLDGNILFQSTNSDVTDFHLEDLNGDSMIDIVLSEGSVVYALINKQVKEPSEKEKVEAEEEEEKGEEIVVESSEKEKVEAGEEEEKESGIASFLILLSLTVSYLIYKRRG
ncbi:MAG: FG-GAP repeat domain-containing protein, partial [Candidatus Methanofastidiosia archaeon]